MMTNMHLSPALCLFGYAECSSEGSPIFIYAVKNINNDRRYVGSTKDLHKRFQQHKRKPPTRMQADWSLHQPFEDNFIMTRLETVYTPTQSKQREYYWIQHYDTQAAAGYNTCKGSPTTDKRFWFLRRLGALR